MYLLHHLLCQMVQAFMSLYKFWSLVFLKKMGHTFDSPNSSHVKQQTLFCFKYKFTFVSGQNKLVFRVYLFTTLSLLVVHWLPYLINGPVVVDSSRFYGKSFCLHDLVALASL